MAKKIDLTAEAAAMTENMEDDKEIITEELLFDMCPDVFMKEFKKAKSEGQRADFYYAADQHRKEINRESLAMDKFLAKLGKWFKQKLPDNDATGISGKIGKVSIKKGLAVSVTDWPALYAYIRKNNTFEFLNKATNVKSFKERWDAGKQIPGAEPLEIKKVSITKV